MIVRGLIYILQSEYYNVRRFLKFAYTHMTWWQLEKRQKLTWTKKTVLIYILSLVLFLGIVLFLFFNSTTWGVVGVVFLYFLLPFVVVVINYFISPLDFLLKQRIIKKAQDKLRNKKMIVIGITGSYGKTSMKEILTSILREKYKVIKTPDNVNTDMGVAQFILGQIEDEEIFIVEMGAYKKGDIKKLASIVNPDYSILTGINESHLDRFGSIERTIETKFELPEATRKKSFLNFDDQRVRKNARNFDIKDLVEVESVVAENKKPLDDYRGIEFDYKGEKIVTKLLGMHNTQLILLGLKLAQEIGLTLEDIKTGVAKVCHIPHRLEPIFNNSMNVVIIDDSYNANFDGVKSGLDVLGRAKGRKIVLTPGPLVELGKKSEEIHKKIGSMYAELVDLVLLIRSKETKAVSEGMRDSGSEDYRFYEDTKSAHDDLKNILKSGDTVLFQNDWPDVYF